MATEVPTGLLSDGHASYGTFPCKSARLRSRGINESVSARGSPDRGGRGLAAGRPVSGMAHLGGWRRLERRPTQLRRDQGPPRSDGSAWNGSGSTP